MKFLRKVLFFSLMLLALCLCVSAQAKTFSIPFGMELVAMGKGDVFQCRPNISSCVNVEWDFSQTGNIVRATERSDGSITVVANEYGVAAISGRVIDSWGQHGDNPLKINDVIQCEIHVVKANKLPKDIKIKDRWINLDPVFRNTYTPVYTVSNKKSPYNQVYWHIKDPKYFHIIDQKTGTIKVDPSISIPNAIVYTATLPNGLYDTAVISVSDISTIEIVPETNTTIKRNNEKRFSAKVNGGLSDVSAVWTVNKPNLISITQIDPQTISVTGVKKGKVVLTASIGEIKDSITLKIK